MSDIHPAADLLDLAYPYALDALSEADRQAIDRQLARADEETATTFRDTVHELRETLAALTIVDAVPAPPSVEAALDHELDARLSALGHTGSEPATAARRVRAVRWLAAAAAIVVVIGTGVGIAVYRSQSHPSGEVTAQQVIGHTDTRTKTTEITGGGTITVEASRQLGAALVSFTAVASPPADHTYQLWLISPAGQPYSAGVLDTLPTDRAPMLMKFGDAEQLAVSVEPTGGSPAPTTTPIVGVPLT
ncbi:anti-sigma factor domain-containing protein [Nocardia sp. NBC_00511]|uniref:anti-sigma factor n=1 Tax=Nocardia sp. NBC_00511 TaxID=2903591 RepID=UPI0030E5E43D